MNRRSSTYDNSEDSESDWDSTVNESPTHSNPPLKIQLPTANKTDETLYATVQPKQPKNPKVADSNNKEPSTEKVANTQSPNYKQESKLPNTESLRELSATGLSSPPPHLSSFRNALSDYSTVYEVMPDIPSRGYETKGKLYTVPESDMFMSTSQKREVPSWNDSDAEERVLKELQQERDKLKRVQAASRDRKHIVSVNDKSNIAAENYGYMSSPHGARSNESVIDKKNRTSEVHVAKSPLPAMNSDHHSEIVKISGNIKEAIPVPQMFQSKMSAPVIIKDATGKSCIFYFEEGSPHFVEVSDDEINAYLPEKVDKLEKLFRRVWREVFAAFRILTSIVLLFFAELILFIVHHIVRPLLLDTIRAIGDFLFKPLFTLLFNVIIHPIFALLWNILNALCQALEPLVKLLGAICTQVAIVLRAFRLFVVNQNSSASYRRGETEMV
ncbi:sarcosine dehydrogenase mitochondrial-like protein [Biomphalaria glabrata]|uniref:Uncharacterized protein LOC106054356 isoform X1 n=1 Tax=Biomphalaria glabrata TaxID=6526 RepID=A0A9W3BJS3_BIOGL|nr:uncharacterized protein LOC106054356 isoform X1 [Biomphalaria glabrata]XP_055899667.1 uncharacterized protein LOC106054356 isoform X1 [Biomphalaria glabrata]XP_055899668.1 uncharacterized protein LOC106054356 isoform X1 [Biomphalaria glabrata]KAI8760288.1 bromodomain-containing protein 4 isoform X1 [Biomphalaria glabrata]